MVLLDARGDAKTIKGESAGYYTGILYLAPSDEAQRFADLDETLKGVRINTCGSESPFCKKICIYHTGRARNFTNIKRARIRKTLWLYRDRTSFVEQLRKDIRELIRKAAKYGLIPCVRVNGSSDLYWLAKQMSIEFPDVQFYDYTAHKNPWLRTRPNYHLTFSLKENNWERAQEALAHGINLSVVFDLDKKDALPTEWRGLPVIDGDVNDLRFLDGYQGVVIGLREKDSGNPEFDATGFVQIVPQEAL